MEFHQTELRLGVVSDSGNPHAPSRPTYDPYWDELMLEEQSTCEDVREQVSRDAQEVAPEHNLEFNHWVENYWVKRGSKKYWYFRYVWMDGRKIKRKHLGSISSYICKYKREFVKGFIQAGFSPMEIIQLIDWL